MKKLQVKKLFAKVPVAKAQQAKKTFISAGVLDNSFPVQKGQAEDKGFVYFPVKKAVPDTGFEYQEREANKKELPQSLKEALENELSEKELEVLIQGHDVVGSIILIEIPKELERKEEQIALAALQVHSHATTVLKKVGQHQGEFRTQRYECIAGIDTRETIVTESGCRFAIDVEEVYYSVRLSTERLRVASLVKPQERVLVMFSGAAPYVVIIAKKSLAKEVFGVEKNPVGHKLGVENLKINKIKNAKLFEADCANLTKLSALGVVDFDRIIMPLPASSENFLASALSVANPKNSLLHVYKFGKESETTFIVSDLIEKITAEGWNATIERIVKAGHHKPFVYRWCFDIRVNKK